MGADRCLSGRAAGWNRTARVASCCGRSVCAGWVVKICSKCHVARAESDFYVRKRSGKHEARCKFCARQATREWNANNKEKKKSYSSEHWKRWRDPVRSAKHRQTRRSSVNGRAKEIHQNSVERAKRVGLNHTINEIFVRHLVQSGCAISGIGFDLKPNSVKGKRNPFAPSLDRRQNAEGYTFTNTQCVLAMVNFAKNEHPEIDFIAMCCAVAERHAHRPEVIQRLKELRNAEF